MKKRTVIQGKLKLDKEGPQVAGDVGDEIGFEEVEKFGAGEACFGFGSSGLLSWIAGSCAIARWQRGEDLLEFDDGGGGGRPVL